MAWVYPPLIQRLIALIVHKQDHKGRFDTPSSFIVGCVKNIYALGQFFTHRIMVNKFDVGKKAYLMELQDTHKEILALCAEHETGFWLIVKRIGKDGYFHNCLTGPVHQKVIQIIRDLLQAGLVEAGNASGSKFLPLFSSVEETINYVECEWEKLSGVPTLGDICWFRATQAGKRLVYGADRIT